VLSIAFLFLFLRYKAIIKGATTAPTPARNVHMPLTGVIQAFVKLAKCSWNVYGGKTVRVKLEDSAILTLLLLLKVSPPLLVIDVGKEIFAFIGNVYGFASAPSRTFMDNVELPDSDGEMEVLLGETINSTSSL
jgi:hypothetical protein